MKILLINVVYNKGSTGNIVKSLYEAYKDEGHDPYVIFGRGKNNFNDSKIEKHTFEFESKLHHFVSSVFGNMYGGMFFSTRRIIRAIKKIKPDCVNLHCLNGYFVNIYKLLNFLQKNNYKTLLTMHADFMMTGGCGYSVDCQNYLTCMCKNCKRVKEFNSRFSFNRTHFYFNKMKNSISKFKKNNLKITCVSPWLAKRYSESSIYKNFDVCSIENPVDDIFFKANNLNLIEDKYFLYVTPNFYDKEKNGIEIEKIAGLLPNYKFIVVSTKKVDYAPLNSNIQIISGGVDKETLVKYYRNAIALVVFYA